MKAVFCIVLVTLGCGLAAHGATSQVTFRITDDVGGEVTEEFTIDCVLDPDQLKLNSTATRTGTNSFELYYGPVGTAYNVTVSSKSYYTLERRIVITKSVTDIWLALERKSMLASTAEVVGSINVKDETVDDIWVRLVPLIRLTNDARDIRVVNKQGDFRFQFLPVGRYLLLVLARTNDRFRWPVMLRSETILIDEIRKKVEVNLIIE